MAATATPSSPSDLSGQVLAEAARRMVPVLVGKLLTALADQAVAKVDRLADRLDDYRDHGPAPSDGDEDEDDDGADPPTTMTGTALAFLAQQVRAALAVVVRLIAQAAEMLRRATERLRARRAPEGIEAEAEDLDAEDLDEEWDDEDDAGFDDELDDDELEDDELEDDDAFEEDAPEPAMAGR